MTLREHLRCSQGLTELDAVVEGNNGRVRHDKVRAEPVDLHAGGRAAPRERDVRLALLECAVPSFVVRGESAIVEKTLEDQR